MIRDYADHAANERTFLAWLRTGMAVVAFGFVIEKFNLFVLTLADANSLDAASRAHFDKLPGPFGFGAGHAFIVVGILVILIATIRFVRTGRFRKSCEQPSEERGRNHPRYCASRSSAGRSGYGPRIDRARRSRLNT